MEAGKDVTLEFRISDTGIGIPTEVQGRLFQPFTQADGSTTRTYGGTGLGLSISQTLVNLLGGNIGFQSDFGVGSTFWFVIPLQKNLDVLEEDSGLNNPLRSPVVNMEENGREQSSSFMKGQTSPRIMVVEDNPVNQKVAVKMLHRLGIEPVLTSNGKEAVALFQRELFDIILMDCQMPEMDGYAATAEIRKLTHEHNVIIIAMTANALEGDREKCLTAGMDDYLAKPVKTEELKKKLSYWLDRLPIT